MAFVSPLSVSSRALSSPSACASHRSQFTGRFITAQPRARLVNVPTAVLEVEKTTLTEYDQLEKLTTIVEDTGDVKAIAGHRPHDATTNPSLVAKAAEMPEYANLVEEAVDYGKKIGGNKEQLVVTVRDKLFTLFGKEILKYVPGDVSTEVDARLSFDAEAQVSKAKELIKMYEDVGVKRERVLIKLASTWEGMVACKELESGGIRTNMTLMFSIAQAAAAADRGAYLVSPFVGRILDWYKKANNVDSYPPEQDPGVLSVKQIYSYYKTLGYKTIVMGASFRNKGEILELAGCDRLTISPQFIEELKTTQAPVVAKLSEASAINPQLTKIPSDEKSFRWMMNEDPMATEKLAEGIRGFSRDLEKLDKKLSDMLL